jgi:hypothetical protein
MPVPDKVQSIYVMEKPVWLEVWFNFTCYQHQQSCLSLLLLTDFWKFPSNLLSTYNLFKRSSQYTKDKVDEFHDDKISVSLPSVYLKSSTS